MALSPAQAFLNSATPAQALIEFAGVVDALKPSITKEGIRLLEGVELDQVSSKVVEIAEKVVEIAETLGAGTLRNELEVRAAGQKVVTRLAAIYGATDKKIQSIPIAEHGCKECQELPDNQGITISLEEGIIATCDKCNKFMRNVRASNILGFGARFQNPENYLF